LFDGPADIVGLEKTTANKTLVKDFVQDVLTGLNPEKLTEYFNGDHYVQHNPAIADGLSGLGAALQAMAKQGIVMKYDKIHGLVGEGNFVLVVSEGVFARNPTSFYDLFRVENGKLAEHWDVMETILPKMNGRMVTGSSINTLKNQ
jgi:predicted SnoaL-like aldol condensation-catalyzing enzyme